MSNTRCSIEDCSRPIRSTKSGLCNSHYTKLRRYGNPLTSKRPYYVQHGLYKHPLYRTWTGMKSRCYNTENIRYEHYGGRGITVCEQWIHDFPQFLKDMGERPSGQTLDRIDNDGNYTPENCRWATLVQQAHNQGIRRNNTSGTMGVARAKKGWRAYLMVDREYNHLGTFKKKQDAILARRHAELALG